MQRDLVVQAMGGDHDAFSELARLGVDRMYAIARLILRDNARAEDATQEALVAAWRKIRSLRDPDRFDAWLRRILLNECYREARREQERFRHEAHVESIEVAYSTDAVSALADRDQLERGFARLKPEQRALIVMHFYLGLPMAETADALGIPEGTVKSRLHRTTAILRASLDAEARTSTALKGRVA
jgi:RNA polymerase sigma-70 factor (ECF subfamily)